MSHQRAMYPIIQVPAHAEEVTEFVGSKRKFWYQNQTRLFKASTPNTGEHWAEKVACELCGLLGLPNADYELACCGASIGVVSTNFVPATARLVLGNELLANIHPDYPIRASRGVVAHNLSRIYALMTQAKPSWGLPPGWQAVVGVTAPFPLFVGYLLLDAWLANQDRHHENWGVVVDAQRVFLAPTFDHAACLGQNETDATRRKRFASKDKNYHVNAYVTKARSALYDAAVSQNKPLTTLEAFNKAKALAPTAGVIWLDRLRTVTARDCQNIFHRLPPECGITEPAITFALKILELNRQRLLAL